MATAYYQNGTYQTLQNQNISSRLGAETQRTLANMMTQHFLKLGYATLSELDIDPMEQDAITAHPSAVNLLFYPKT